MHNFFLKKIPTMIRFDKTINILLIFTLMFCISCNKNTNNIDLGNQNDTCSCNLDTTIISFSIIFLEDSLNSYYYNSWKSILKQKSNMTDVYFDKHVQNITISPSAWAAGITYRVDYLMCYDWLKIKCFDEFIIKLDSSYNAYYGYLTPRNRFLSKSQIEYNLSKDILSEISTYQLIETLPYNNINSLCAAIRRDMGLTTFNINRISYFVPGKLPREDGYLYAIIDGQISGSTSEDAKCFSGYYNLLDRSKHQVRIQDCIIR